ncbi:MFS transporter [Hypericibacter adhaerens]|jgi:MFS family permease|uniref:MFS transporter n=1 Tax=Hypericibacter adhaerens TaxID=2602016 RepID=A0A5J6MYC2_9PROT|nr:MFS transporter [Hypericibacter adhaerens]QEX22762.1 MFS transporter [Hypericibacter adhaerens]
MDAAAHERRPARTALAVAAVGHFVLHVLIGLYVVLVLALEQDWSRSYAELIALWTIPSLLIGLGAPLAGWLSDRWGELTLMTIFFLGCGGAAILAGLADGPASLTLALMVLGLFASIYHPVGSSLAIRNAVNQGKVMGWVGVCGSLGVAAASPVAGAMTAWSGWRSAFILPGAVALLLGLALPFLRRAGWLVERSHDLVERPAPTGATLRRAAITLCVTMLLFSVIYAAFTTALPKWLEGTLPVAGRAGILDLTLVIGAIYLVGSLGQIVGGWLVDHGSAKWAYSISFFLKALLLAGAVFAERWETVALAAAVAFLFDIGSPSESVLLARYAPQRRRGLIYGIRHGIGILATPIGVQAVALLYGWQGGFSALFWGLAGCALAVGILAALLPGEARPMRAGERAAA